MMGVICGWWEFSMLMRRVGLLLLRLSNSSLCPRLAISSQQSFASCEVEEKKKHHKDRRGILDTFTFIFNNNLAGLLIWLSNPTSTRLTSRL